jgi:hypothetical protein
MIFITNFKKGNKFYTYRQGHEVEESKSKTTIETQYICYIIFKEYIYKVIKNIKIKNK